MPAGCFTHVTGKIGLTGSSKDNAHNNHYSRPSNWHYWSLNPKPWHLHPLANQSHSIAKPKETEARLVHDRRVHYSRNENLVNRSLHGAPKPSNLISKPLNPVPKQRNAMVKPHKSDDWEQVSGAQEHKRRSHCSKVH